MSSQRILDLEIAYDVEGIVKGGSRIQTVTVKETLPFMVREVDAGRLRPGISVHDDRHALRTDFPLIDGALHRKAKPQPYVSKDVPSLAETKFREVLSHGRDAAVARLQSRVDAGAIFEDTFYAPTLGPVLAMRGAGLSDRPTLVPAETVNVPAYAVGIEGNIEVFLEALRLGTGSVPREAVDSLLSLVNIHVPGCTDARGFDDRTAVDTARRVFDTEPTNRRIGKYPNGYLRGWLAYHEEGFARGEATEELLQTLQLAATGLNSYGPYSRLDEADRKLVDLLREAHLAHAKRAAWDAAPEAPAP